MTGPVSNTCRGEEQCITRAGQGNQRGSGPRCSPGVGSQVSKCTYTTRRWGEKTFNCSGVGKPRHKLVQQLWSVLNTSSDIETTPVRAHSSHGTRTQTEQGQQHWWEYHTAWLLCYLQAQGTLLPEFCSCSARSAHRSSHTGCLLSASAFHSRMIRKPRLRNPISQIKRKMTLKRITV